MQDLLTAWESAEDKTLILYHLKRATESNKKSECYARACMLIGDYYSSKSEWGEALSWYFRSLRKNVDAATFLSIARVYRLQGKNVEGLHFALSGKSLDRVDENIGYELDNEILICAFYTEEKNEGFQACERVTLSNAPWGLRNSSLHNQGFYMTKLPVERKFKVPFELPTGYVDSSPSLVPSGDGYKYNLRGVNYNIASNGSYIIHDPQGVVRTRNFLLSLDERFSVKDWVELVDIAPGARYLGRIQGMEDIRLFGHNRFFCTFLETNPGNIPQISMGCYEENGEVKEITPLKVTFEIQMEKNWLPFTHDGETHFIYCFHPFTLYRVENSTVVQVVERHLVPQNIDQFRGGAPPIPYKGGYLCTIHQVVYQTPRKYFHRFVWLSADFTQLLYSPPFYFDSVEIEFNLSICHTPEGLAIPYSFRDSQASIAIMDYSVLDNFLGIDMSPVSNQ